MADPPGLTRRAVFGAWPALLLYSILFRAAESLVFLPAAGLAGSFLTGGGIVESKAVLGFLLSPRGIAALVGGVAGLFLLRLLEHAGLSAILAEATNGRRLRAEAAARTVLHAAPALARLALRIALGLLLRLLPLLALSAVVAISFLRRADINFWIAERPPEALAAVGTLALAALVTAAVAIEWIARIRLSVQLLLFEGLPPRAAMERSAELTRHRRAPMIAATVAIALLSLAAAVLASGLGSLLARPTLTLFRGAGVPVAVTVLVLLLVRGSIALLVTQAVTALDAILFTGLYARFAGRLPSVHARAPSRGSRLVATALATVAGAGATSSALLLAGTVGPGAAIEVHAHRGSLAHGPENSLPAFEGAIAAGADAVETDVQLTRDGTLILVHDADLRRVAGLSIRAADLTAERLATLRLPGSGERIVTLAELLEVSRGRIRVNIELKRYRDSPPGLVPAVVRAVRSAEMEGEVVVQSFEVSQLRETAEALPGVPVGLLISVPAASPFDVGVDFLSMEQSRIDRGFVQRSHAAGKQVFGWTLRTEPAMRRLVEAGVDGLIAHDVATAIRVRDEWLEANPEERILRQLRAIVVS